jgi:RNA polymerase sigma-70 factor (ECF subfamily)
VSQHVTAGEPAKDVFIAFYDQALPHVYGYLSSRCSDRAVAEEITSEVFLAAVDSARKEPAAPMSVPWAIGVARHKLVDHWRRESRKERGLRALAEEFGAAEADDPWDVRLDAMRARQLLDLLAPYHRAALTLRYLDDLSVPDIAAALGRTVHATEALLVRAKVAFRRAYEGEECDG